MERAKDAMPAEMGTLAATDAANDDAMDAAGTPAPAWDAFEVWRTRVRDPRIGTDRKADGTDADLPR